MTKALLFNCLQCGHENTIPFMEPQEIGGLTECPVCKGLTRLSPQLTVRETIAGSSVIQEVMPEEE